MTRNEISTHLTYHVQTGYLTYNQISDIYDLMPESVYKGKAYRVITGCDKENFNNDPFKNLYWSKSLDGIKHYLSLTKENQKQNYIVVEADIDGVDVNLAFDVLNKDYVKIGKSPRNNPHALEEEILAVDFTNLKVISVIKE